MLVILNTSPSYVLLCNIVNDSMNSDFESSRSEDQEQLLLKKLEKLRIEEKKHK